MARKPSDQANPGREAIWAAIRASGAREPMTAAQLVAATGAHNKTVRDYLKGLVAAGFLKLEEADGHAARWALVRDCGHEAPRVRRDGSPVTQGEVTEQLWRSMYMLKEFSFADLIQTATVTIPVETAKAYCKMLLATGYLQVKQKADPSKARIARYKLIRNNGPKPPQIQRVKRVYDPNTREVFMPEDQA